MAKEIEAKFLLRENKALFTTFHFFDMGFGTFDEFIKRVTLDGKKIRQGYLDLDTARILTDKLALNPMLHPVEARLRDKAGRTYFTLKGDGSVERQEFETEIPFSAFQEFWPVTQGKRIIKTRLAIPYGYYEAEFDVYTDGRDLVTAEVEVPTLEELRFVHPLGKDITQDKSYKNVNLAR